jgi:glutamate carboxypeptidase
MSAKPAIGKRLLQQLVNVQGEMITLLTKIAEAESPSHDAASQLKVQSLLHDALESSGLNVRRIRGRKLGGHLFARPIIRQRGRPLQLLLGHCDTVWPLGTVEEMPVHLANGRLHGPGVFDMKAGLVQAIFAVRALKALGERPAVDPVFFINSDEEIGSPESSQTIRHLARACNRAFVMEPSLGVEGKLKTARKGVGRFTIRVLGKASHAGLAPEEGASAILELSHVIQQLFALNDSDHGVTVNVGTIDGGMRPNVIAPESRAVVDVRVATHDDATRVERAIHELEATTPGTRLVIEGRIGRPPMERTPGNLRLWRHSQEAANEIGFEIEDGMAGGGSDGNSTSLFTPTLDGLGAVGDGAHAINEHILVDHLAERAALLARLLLLPELKLQKRETISAAGEVV